MPGERWMNSIAVYTVYARTRYSTPRNLRRRSMQSMLSSGEEGRTGGEERSLREDTANYASVEFCGGEAGGGHAFLRRGSRGNEKTFARTEVRIFVFWAHAKSPICRRLNASTSKSPVLRWILYEGGFNRRVYRRLGIAHRCLSVCALSKIMPRILQAVILIADAQVFKSDREA